MAIDFDIRDPKNQKLIMTFLIPVVIIAAFFQFMVKPIKEDVAVKKGELNTVRQKLAAVKRSLKTIDALAAEKDMLEIKLASIESLLPTEENVAVLLSQFSAVERDSNVYLVGFDVQERIEGGERSYKANKYRMTVECGYHQFARFIGSIMQLPRILSFSDLNISMNVFEDAVTENYEGLETQPRNLKVEWTLTTYLYQEVASGDDAN